MVLVESALKLLQMLDCHFKAGDCEDYNICKNLIFFMLIKLVNDILMLYRWLVSWIDSAQDESDIARKNLD